MKTPSNGSQISQTWIEYILTQYETKKLKEETVVNVDFFTLSNATKPGESFNAELLKLDVNAKLKKEGNISVDRSYHLIVKFLSLDPFNREVIRKARYHIKEFKIYSEVVNKLNEFQAKRTNNAFPIRIPEFFYGKCTRKEYVLVIENVKESGFGTAQKEQGLTVEQVRLALECIARVHGISYAYNQANDFLSEFPCFNFSPTISQLFKAVVVAAANNVIPFLRSQSGYEKIAELLETGKRKIPQKFNSMWENQSLHPLLCLSHGDFWCSNLLFHPYESDPADICVIDWQICQWNNPIMDLHYLFATSTTASLRSKYLPSLLEHYHTVFTDVTAGLNAPVPNWSLNDLYIEFERLSLVGLLMGICVIQGTLSKAGENINRQGASDTISCGSHCLKNRAKNVVAKIIIPAGFKPSGKFILSIAMSNLFKPIQSELIEGSNPVMNKRLLDLIEEGYQKGLLEILNQ